MRPRPLALASLLLAAALPCAAADDNLTPASAEAVKKEWTRVLLRLRPESADLLSSIKLMIVSAGEMKKYSRRPNIEGHFDWDKAEIQVNGGMLASLRAKVGGKSGDPDRAVALLTLDVIDHELNGHAGLVRRLVGETGRYNGMVVDEEVTAFVTEAEGLTRAYRDPEFKAAIAPVADLAHERHHEIRELIPRGVEGFERLVLARGYGLPNVAAKRKEFDDYADNIKKMKRGLGQSDAEGEADPAVARARENSRGLGRFYTAERARLAALLAAL